MEGILLVCARVQYWVGVNSELVKSLTIQETGFSW